MAKKARKRNGNGAKRKPTLYKAYWFEEADPVIEAYRTAMRQTKMTPEEVKEKGGPVVATQKHWTSGKTKRPHHCTIAAAGKAMGMTGIIWGRGSKGTYFTDEQ